MFQIRDQNKLVLPVLFKNNKYGYKTFTILTTNASKQIYWLHSRQPIILNKNNVCNWLNNENIDNIDLLNQSNIDLVFDRIFVSKQTNKIIKTNKNIENKNLNILNDEDIYISDTEIEIVPIKKSKKNLKSLNCIV